MFVGAHVSIAKGVQNSVTNCVHIGGNAFAMFLKSQRKWENPPLQEESKDQFKAFCSEHKYDSKSQILPHGSYLVNLAQENPEKAEQAYEAFLDDVSSLLYLHSFCLFHSSYCNLVCPIFFECIGSEISSN